MWDKIIWSIINPRLRGAVYLGLSREELKAVADLAALEAEQTWRADGGAQLSTWVYRRVQSRVMDAMAAAAKLVAEDVEYSGSDDDAEARLLVCDALEFLQARLDPDDWRLLWLRHAEGYSGQELAVMWGLTYGSLRGKLHTAKNRALTILTAQG